jgi:hypothetical protein
MGEKTILVCDECGRPASESVTFRVGRRNLVKDFCATHVSELVRGARAPRRGRRPGTALATPKRRGRSPKATTAKKSANGRMKRSAKANS